MYNVWREVPLSERMGTRAINLWIKNNKDKKFYVQYQDPAGTYSSFIAVPLRVRKRGVSMEAEIAPSKWVTVTRLYNL